MFILSANLIALFISVMKITQLELAVAFVLFDSPFAAAGVAPVLIRSLQAGEKMQLVLSHV